jgi:predicted TIM-barrel fold metal-dependent hydrolase
MGQKYYSKEQFMRIMRAHGADKILFASDSPWSCAAEEIASIESLPLTTEEKDMIFSSNAKKILDL